MEESKTEDRFRPYWLTRDEDEHGNLSDKVDVWTEMPERQRIPGGGFMWLGKGVTGIEHRFAQWTIETARKNATIPETSRECVRVY